MLNSYWQRDDVVQSLVALTRGLVLVEPQCGEPFVRLRRPPGPESRPTGSDCPDEASKTRRRTVAWMQIQGSEKALAAKDTG